MKIYKVRLYREKLLPYEINGIKAQNEEEAKEIAKDYIAKNAYWGFEYSDIETRKKLLTVENVTLESIA